jgi:predicted GH43/DUF377 family glycosyl hydrolase
MGWLPGYSARKQLTISGGPDGAWALYQKRLSVRKLIAWTDYQKNYVISPTQAFEGDNCYAMHIATLADGTRISDPATTNFRGYWAGMQNILGVDHDQIGTGTSPDGMVWTKDAGNPILTYTPLAWDSLHVNFPSVCVVGGTYYMFYCGCVVTSQDQIGLATSANPNGPFVKQNGGLPVLTSGFSADEFYVTTPSVIYEGGQFIMIYRAYTAALINSRICRAHSPDGINWVRDGMVLDTYADPEFKRYDASSLIMMCSSAAARMTFAISNDNGFTWVIQDTDPVPLDVTKNPNGQLSSGLVRVGSQWYNYYGAATEGTLTHNRISMAISGDLYNLPYQWSNAQNITKIPGPPTNCAVVIDGADFYEGTGSAKATVTANGGAQFTCLKDTSLAGFDWTKRRYFTFWCKSDAINKSGLVYLVSSAGNYRAWLFNYPAAWGQITVDIWSAPALTAGTWNPMATGWFLFGTNATLAGEHFWIDDVTAYQDDGKVGLDRLGRDDFNDIRFTKNDGVTLLDHWIEQYLTGQWADVWIEFADVPASPATITFYMYYQNPGDAGNSNERNTFIKADAFELEVVGNAPAQWAIGGGTFVTSDEQSISVSQSGKVTASGGYHKLSTPAPVTTVAVHFATRMTQLNKDSQFGIRNSADTLWGAYIYFHTDGKIYYQDGGGAHLVQTYNANQWYNLELRNFNFVSNIVDLWIDDTLLVRSLPFWQATADIQGLMFYENTAGVVFYNDNVFVRNYTKGEPTWGAWGVPEFFPFKGGGGMAAKLLGARAI